MQAHTNTDQLSGWMTMRDVSNALGITHNTVRHAVRRALYDRQDWIKRAPYPGANDQIRVLIDTSHPAFQCHVRRWQKRAEHISAAPERAHRCSCCTPDIQAQAFEVTETWPELCDWLAKHGLVVFVNALVKDQGWQWSWLEQTGSGYPDITAAITAAIEQQLRVSNTLWSGGGYTTPIEVDLPAEPEPSGLYGLFRKKW